MDEEQIREIKAEFVKSYPEDGKNENNVIVRQCLGVYGRSIAIMINYDDRLYTQALWEEKVGGITVHYVDGQYAMIYKKK